VTRSATPTDKLRELDEGTRRAWKAYWESIQSLTGDAYERAEVRSWIVLQDELRRLESNRRVVTSSTA
jgi:hypothetical protein